MQQLIRDDAVATQISQAEMIQTYASISPVGLYESSLRSICATGAEGFKSFYRSARRYQQQLHEFILQRDKADTNPANPHLVHSQGNRCVQGIFSTLPVDFTTVPRWHNIFQDGGLPADIHFPLVELMVLFLENLFVAGVAFAAFARYDPR
jgi:hypothetical protein